MEYTHVIHPFEPIYNNESKILILGSLPSVKSRENNFFYGHKRNRFWKLIAMIFNEPIPDNVDQKKDLLLRHNIAIWDTIYCCDIKGSSDSSIRNVVPTDLTNIINNSNIHMVFCNGKTSEKYYNKYHRAKLHLNAKVLPSSSPANAAWSIDKLLNEWSIIKDYTE